MPLLLFLLLLYFEKKIEKMIIGAEEFSVTNYIESLAEIFEAVSVMRSIEKMARIQTIADITTTRITNYS